jgi:hypothetical protein
VLQSPRETTQPNRGRQQLSALSRDHLLAVIDGYLRPIEVKASATDRELVDDIVQAVHQLSNATSGD